MQWLDLINTLKKAGLKPSNKYLNEGDTSQHII